MAYYYYAYGIEPPVSEIERLMGRTRLGSLLLRLIDIARGESPNREIVRLFRRRTAVWIEREVEVTRRYLRDLREAAAAQDSALLVLLIPRPEGVPSPSARYQAALQLFEELGLPYLNPIHLLDAELDYPPDDFHWNSAGHQKIGTMLSDCIEVFQVSGDLSDCEEVTMPEPR